MIAMTLAIILAAGGAWCIKDGAMGFMAGALVKMDSGIDPDVKHPFIHAHGMRMFFYGPALILAALCVARWG